MLENAWRKIKVGKSLASSREVVIDICLRPDSLLLFTHSAISRLLQSAISAPPERTHAQLIHFNSFSLMRVFCYVFHGFTSVYLQYLVLRFGRQV